MRAENRMEMNMERLTSWSIGLVVLSGIAAAQEPLEALLAPEEAPFGESRSTGLAWDSSELLRVELMGRAPEPTARSSSPGRRTEAPGAWSRCGRPMRATTLPPR
jgi:hypothetical protein